MMLTVGEGHIKTNLRIVSLTSALNSQMYYLISTSGLNPDK